MKSKRYAKPMHHDTHLDRLFGYCMIFIAGFCLALMIGMLVQA